MQNSDLFVLNPTENNLLNDGVVNINTAKDQNGLKTIYHEIKTFVCEGEYEQGMDRILKTYLKFIDQPKQPAVWVSGFFGSGKSHLIKMLSFYWEDFKFPNGETARSIKELPNGIKAYLVELDRKQKLHGSLAISGTLKDFPSRDIRYSFLQLMLNSLGLPQQYHHFKFIHWAKQEGILDEIIAQLKEQGRGLERELENLFVSSYLAKAVLAAKPEFAETEAKAREAFKAQFKRVEHVDRNQLLSTIKQEILPMFYGDKIPCTIIVLDEVQQFIGQDASKTIDIQNLAQDICDHFDGKFLLIGSGQNALAETPQLSPLRDRFSVTVALGDTDVDKVTRKTVLEKKASQVKPLEDQLEKSLGEISRCLNGTGFSYSTEDRNTLAADYPMLPSIRKFWRKMLQRIDTAGTSGQLRSQLRIVDESLKKVATRPVGTVVPGDFIFEQKRQQLLQNAILLNETDNLIADRKAKGGDALLEGRIISVVFLLDQLPKDLSGGGLASNADTIADLLIEDITNGTDSFRGEVKKAIEKLVDEKVLMPIGEEYKLQTKAGQEWEQEYTSQAVKLTNSGEDVINRFRQEAFMSVLNIKTKGLNILQGTSKQRREFELWDREERPDTSTKLHLWVKDGWNESETFVLKEIREEGTDSPLSYLYIPKERDQDLRGEIIKHLAAKATLETKGLSSEPEVQQAMKSMETRSQLAKKSVSELIERIAKESKVYTAGGALIDSGDLTENIRTAFKNIADRQFYEFKGKGDFKDWDKALIKAQSNDPEALKRIGYSGETKDHPVAIEILRFIGNGAKTGKEIRGHFMKAPFGWSQDAIDTMLIILKLTEIVSSNEPNLRPGTMNAAQFKKELHSLTAKEKLSIRKLFTEAGINCKPGDEFITSNDYLAKLRELTQKVSGEPPLPKPISTDFITEIQNLDSNERLIRIAQEESDLSSKYKEWTAQSKLVDERMPKWDLITSLSDFLPAENEELQNEVNAVRDSRLIFQEPDPIEPLLQKMVKVLNDALLELENQFVKKYDRLMEDLQGDEHFKKLDQKQKHAILARNQLLHKPEPKRLEARPLANHLSKLSLDGWRTKISALDAQFQAAREEAIKLSEPKAELYNMPKRTLKSEAEIDSYLQEVKQELTDLIKTSGSVILI
ncbi:MAG: BREX system P-loop protein BrxC [Bacteroidetes bacterium]|nr:BREX system P-loop protein BrxC [Bacteroidota bacterium]